MSNVPTGGNQNQGQCPPSPADAFTRILIARMTAGAIQVWKPVLVTTMLLVGLIVLLLATVGFRTEVQDPTRVDAGLWRRMSFNNDNARRIETKNRLGNVEAYKHTRAGSYKLSYDEDGGIWVPTGPRK